MNAVATRAKADQIRETAKSYLRQSKAAEARGQSMAAAKLLIYYQTRMAQANRLYDQVEG